MAMDPRLRNKEILRMAREIELIETSIEKNSQAAGAKQTENKQLADSINEQEAENDKYNARIEELDGQVAELDEEFRDNQILATRLRKETKLEENSLKILTYLATGKRDRDVFDQIVEDLPADSPLRIAVKVQEPMEPKLERLRNQLADLENRLKDMHRSGNDAELKLRRTEAKIEEIQKHPMSKPVTMKLEKLRRQEQQEREERGVVERTMMERLSELESTQIPTTQEFVKKLMEEAGKEGTPVQNGAAAEDASAAEEKAADTGGSGLDLDF